MNKFMNVFKTIGINIISNIIFEIIIWIGVCISTSSLIYYFISKTEKLAEKNITISILNIIIVSVIVFILSGVTLLILKYKKRSTNIESSHCVFNEEGYYFTDSEKHVTIYKNGQGIIIHRSVVIVSDVDQFTQLKRRISVKDGVKTLKFPSLDTMLKTSKDKRFSDFGFWYTSDNNIISEVKEYYWDHSRDPNAEDKIAKEDPQELRWYFSIDKSKLKKEKPYEIYYIITIPGLAALTNGHLNSDLLRDPSENKTTSSMKIVRHMKHFTYTVAFEEGIELSVEPTAKCIIEGQDKVKELDIPCTIDYDLLYKKYIFDIQNPIFGSNIVISWKYKTL